MAEHEVTVKLPPRELKRADAEFSVKRNGAKFGTLTVSNGALVWFPPYTKYGCKIGWKKFHEMMDKHATRVEKRK